MKNNARMCFTNGAVDQHRVRGKFELLSVKGHSMREALRHMREQSGDWHQVAALRAENVFRQANFDTFAKLREAAEQAEAWPAVRDAAMHYLETGERPPTPTPGGKRKRQASAWPLPQPDVEEPASNNMVCPRSSDYSSTTCTITGAVPQHG